MVQGILINYTVDNKQKKLIYTFLGGLSVSTQTVKTSLIYDRIHKPSNLDSLKDSMI